MKISNISPPDQARAIDQGKADKAKVEKTGASAASATDKAASSTEVSTQPTLSQDIDQVRVNEIREAIKEGRLEPDTDKIADALITSVRSMLNDEKT